MIDIEKIKKSTEKFARVRLKKIHLDYIAGLLSIPVLITAIIINWGNLSHHNNVPTSQASPSPQVIIVPQNTSVTATPVSSSCIKSIGPITITSPTEGQNVTDNPVCITIDYADPSYCPVIWSYRINGGSWSDFNNSSPCLYNLPSGTVQFNLRVNSTTSSDQKTLTRTFTYSGSGSVTPTTSQPTPTLVASSSAH